MRQGQDDTAGATLDAWFRGQASDEDLIAWFLPTRKQSPLERLRRLAETMNLAKQMMEYGEFAILREAERTAGAIREMSEQPQSGSMFEATRLALEDHYDALQLLVQACQEANEERMLEALQLAERAESTMRCAGTAAESLSDHIQRLSVP